MLSQLRHIRIGFSGEGGQKNNKPQDRAEALMFPPFALWKFVQEERMLMVIPKMKLLKCPKSAPSFCVV
jgi:hypothetical protein